MSEPPSKHIHILGIAGTFMGGVAALARELGHEVEGSDQAVYPPMSTQLETLGIALKQGYAPENISADCDEVVIGKGVGLALALTAAQALGFGGGGLVVALLAGPDQLPGFVALTALSIVLGWLAIACALWIATAIEDRVRALAVALLGWFVAVVGYDLAVLGATSMLSGLPLESVLVPALLLNPIDLTRVLVTLAVGSGALFGPTAAVLAKWFGAGGGAALGAAALAVETIVPLVLALRAFRRRDG